MAIQYVFLPGLDGTGILFDPIVHLLKESTPPIRIAYPSDRFLDYHQLESLIVPQLPSAKPYILIAESFGGPIAARIAARQLPMLRGLVLSATFVRRPRGRLSLLSTGFIGPYLFRRRFLRSLAYPIMRWQGLPDPQIEWLFNVLDHTRPDILAARLREALEVDVLEEFKHCSVPVLCLYAEHDLLIADWCKNEMQQANIRVRVLGFDTPHFLLQTQPALALQAIQEFAHSLESPA